MWCRGTEPRAGVVGWSAHRQRHRGGPRSGDHRPGPAEAAPCGGRRPAPGHPTDRGGHRLVAGGYPEAHHFTRSVGRLLAVTAQDGMNMLVTDVPAAPGSSGSPLLDPNGTVVGVIFGGSLQRLHAGRAGRRRSRPAGRPTGGALIERRAAVPHRR
ncbi:MAG: trypsin-like peptidase domain-containing protein [Acidimicrobiales bacterium]